MSKLLEKEFKYYIDNQDELVKEYRGKFIVIKNDKVLSAYDSILEAIKETSKTEKVGTFLVQKCEPGEENYTQVFHSRATFI